VISGAEMLRTGPWLNPKDWARGIMDKLRADPHSELEPLTDTWTSESERLPFPTPEKGKAEKSLGSG
jgi:hypothetical protein